MRNLTIKREKKYTASLAKMKVYLEDPASAEIVIDKTPCRLLGTLKNGEEKTFEISEAAAKVYVIADKVSKNYCFEFFRLPEGQEDISLTGHNKLNFASGNAFRFDGNDDPEALANRKKGSKKGLLVLIAAVVVGGLLGYGITTAAIRKAPEPKEFSEAGMNIVLTDAFRETDIEPFTAAFESKESAVFAVCEPFTLMEGFEDYSLEAYTDLVLTNNGLDAEVKTEGERLCYEYTVEVENAGPIHYMSFPYKTGEAFWLVQFAAAEDSFESLRPDILNYANSVSFDE